MIITKITKALFFISSIVPLLTFLLPPISYAQDEAIAYSGITESRMMFQDYCASCHGENLEGSAQGSPLRGNLTYGESMNDVNEYVASTSKQKLFGLYMNGLCTKRSAYGGPIGEPSIRL